MRILYSSTLLASDNVAAGLIASGLSWNSEPVLDVVSFFRDAKVSIFARGDSAEVFAFDVWRLFSTEAEVVTFCSTHRAALPLQADLLLTDEAATYALRMANAARSFNVVRRVGLSVLVQYKFTGRQFLSEDVPDLDPEDVDVKKYGTVFPAADAEDIVVTYGTAFGAEPRWFELTIEPAGGQPPVWVVGYKSVTAAGFTAILSAAIPAGGYKARWKAEL